MMEKLNEMANSANDFEVINGKKYPRKSWSDIVKENPDKWVMFTNAKIVDDDKMFVCTILSICDNNDRTAEHIRLLDEGYNVTSMRTTSNVIGGVNICKLN